MAGHPAVVLHPADGAQRAPLVVLVGGRELRGLAREVELAHVERPAHADHVLSNVSGLVIEVARTGQIGGDSAEQTSERRGAVRGLTHARSIEQMYDWVKGYASPGRAFPGA